MPAPPVAGHDGAVMLPRVVASAVTGRGDAGVVLPVEAGSSPTPARRNTTWDFTSAEPTTDDTLPGTGCAGTALGISTAPCQADPLVFPDYNAGLAAANTITPGIHQLQVIGYHQDPSAPPVTSLKLWTSTDGGTAWQSARVIRGRSGTFKVIYRVPAPGTNGYVSIKAEASDAAGNDITQVIDNTYAIAAAPATGARAGS